MALSLVIHVACLLGFDRLVSGGGEPPAPDEVLIVRLHTAPTVEGAADLDSDQPAPEGDFASAGEEGMGRRASEPPQKVADASTTAVATEKATNSEQPAKAPPTSGNDAEVDAGPSDHEARVATAAAETVAKSDVVTTISKSDIVAAGGATEIGAPAFEQAPLSPKQQKMLERKFRKWTEDFYRMADLDAGLTWRHKGQEYVAKFTQLPTESDMGIERVIVEISTVEDGRRLSTEMRMKRLAFSNYAQFVNRWEPNVQIHNDQLDGRFHSNSEINLAYTRKARPQFHGEVTTSARKINWTERHGRVGRDEIFKGGLQTGVRAIYLPKRYIPFPRDADMEDDQVHRFDQDSRIVFRADGSYSWHPIGAESSRSAATLSDSPTYLVAEKKVSLHVKGIVNGKVLVYSPERIVIEDDLVYAQDPERIADSDDYLGLASDKYIDIAPPNVTGYGDLVIHAAIYAKRRFSVTKYRNRSSALLHIYGSLTAGTLSATEPRFYTKIQFDRRLEHLRPPGFPTTDRYEIESADSGWRVEPIEMFGPEGT